MKSNTSIAILIAASLLGSDVVLGADNDTSKDLSQYQDSTAVCATQWCTVSDIIYKKSGNTDQPIVGGSLPVTIIKTTHNHSTILTAVPITPNASGENIIFGDPSLEKSSHTKKACKQPLFALKTNLLFDALTALNVEIEVPFGKRWSVAGEWMFPWWLAEKQQNSLQALSGNLEFRYWFKKHPNRADQLTGWFVGLYAGGGLYDIEWHRKGYQGEFYIAAGVSGGYAHNISRNGNLRMEYSLGLGYLKTNYRQYESRTSDNKLVWKADGHYTFVGPTRAKVSLVWMMDWGKMLKKEGGKR